MDNTRQSTSMNNAESYANHAEAAEAAAYGKAKSEEAIIKEATVAAHVADTALISPIASRDEITQATAALDSLKSSNEGGCLP